MALDRGPCACSRSCVHDNVIIKLLISVLGLDASSFFIAAGKNEQMVMERHSSSSSWYRRKPTHDYAVHSKLLSMYIESVPTLCHQRQ